MEKKMDNSLGSFNRTKMLYIKMAQANMDKRIEMFIMAGILFEISGKINASGFKRRTNKGNPSV